MTTFDENYETPPLQILADRQRNLARSMGDLLKWRREVDKDRTSFDISIRGLAEDVKTVKQDLTTVKRLLIGLLVTAVTGSVSVTIAILVSTGKHP